MDQPQERDIQITRLLIMMYRQGWIDATAYLRAETTSVAHRIKADYDRLLTPWPKTDAKTDTATDTKENFPSAE